MSVSSKSMTFCSLILLILCVLNIFAQDKTIILIQYLFDGEECGVTFKTHGNSRQTQATSYVRTNPSVLVQYVFENSGPNGTVHMVSEENGGYLQATSGGDLPRNREQAKNCRSRSTKSSSKNLDSLTILLQECKRQQMSAGQDPFIRDVTGALELCCVLTYNSQLEEIKKFCTNHVGPLLVSQTKTSETYNYFFGKLASLNKNLKKLWHYELMENRLQLKQ